MRLLIALGGCLLLVSGCTPERTNQGILEGADGSITFLYKPCRHDALIYSVRVTAPDKKGLVKPDDSPVWGIVSSEGSLERRFPVGVVPEGFTEDVPLTSGLREHDRLLLWFVTSELPEDMRGFQLDDLRPGEVYVPWEGLMSVGEFWERDTCG